MNIFKEIYSIIIDKYYYAKEVKAEKKYNKLVIDFYENGKGYYGK